MTLWDKTRKLGVALLRLAVLSLVACASMSGQQASSPSFGGRWQASFSDSISTGTLYLTLDVQSDDTVSGTVQAVTGDNIGQISGNVDEGTFYFTFVQTIEHCPGTFSGKLTVKGDAGSGSYVGTDCGGQHGNGVVSMVRTTASEVSLEVQQASPVMPNLAECLVEHKEQGYWGWLCGSEGNAQVDEVSLLYLRRNLFGEYAVFPVGTTGRQQWADKAPQLVAIHQRENADCLAYFHVAYVSPMGRLEWNYRSNNMWNWLQKERPKRFPKLCYALSPWQADYVLVWTDSTYSVPYSFSLTLPQTNYFYGTTGGKVYGLVGGTPVWGTYSGTYSGYVRSTRTETYSGSTQVWKVQAWLYPVKRDASLVFRRTHTGRYAWSKPDKDVLTDALKFIKGQTSSPRNIGKP